MDNRIISMVSLRRDKVHLVKWIDSGVVLTVMMLFLAGLPVSVRSSFVVIYFTATRLRMLTEITFRARHAIKAVFIEVSSVVRWIGLCVTCTISEVVTLVKTASYSVIFIYLSAVVQPRGRPRVTLRCMLGLRTVVSLLA